MPAPVPELGGGGGGGEKRETEKSSCFKTVLPSRVLPAEKPCWLGLKRYPSSLHCCIIIHLCDCSAAKIIRCEERKSTPVLQVASEGKALGKGRLGEVGTEGKARHGTGLAESERRVTTTSETQHRDPHFNSSTARFSMWPFKWAEEWSSAALAVKSPEPGG